MISTKTANALIKGGQLMAEEKKVKVKLLRKTIIAKGNEKDGYVGEGKDIGDIVELPKSIATELVAVNKATFDLDVKVNKKKKKSELSPVEDK